MPSIPLISLLLSLILLPHSLSDNYHQLIPDYSYSSSYDLIHKNTLQYPFFNYTRKGDVIITNKSINMLPLLANTFSYLETRNPITTQYFEFHIILSHKFISQLTRGNIFIWFYKEKIIDTNEININTPLGFANKYQGFGLLIHYYNYLNDYKMKVTFTYNEQMDIVNEANIKENEVGTPFCSIYVDDKTKIKLMVSYTFSGYVDVYYNTPNSLYSRCLSQKIKQNFLGENFKIGMSSKNGFINGDKFLGTVKVHSIKFFNTHQFKKDKYAYKLLDGNNSLLHDGLNAKDIMNKIEDYYSNLNKEDVKNNIDEDKDKDKEKDEGENKEGLIKDENDTLYENNDNESSVIENKSYLNDSLIEESLENISAGNFSLEKTKGFFDSIRLLNFCIRFYDKFLLFTKNLIYLRVPEFYSENNKTAQNIPLEENEPIRKGYKLLIFTINKNIHYFEETVPNILTKWFLFSLIFTSLILILLINLIYKINSYLK